MDTKKPSLNAEIEKILSHMETLQAGTEEYNTALKQLKELYENQKTRTYK